MKVDLKGFLIKITFFGSKIKVWGGRKIKKR